MMSYLCHHAVVPACQKACQHARKTSVGCSEPPVTTKLSQGVPEVQIEGCCATVPDGTRMYLIVCGSLFTLYVMNSPMAVNGVIDCIYSLIDCRH